jgi:hypothetical protein
MNVLTWLKMTSSMKSDISLELLVPVWVYTPNFGLIETTFKIGPTENPPVWNSKSKTHPLFLLVDINDGNPNYVCVLKHSRAGGG